MRSCATLLALALALVGCRRAPVPKVTTQVASSATGVSPPASATPAAPSAYVPLLRIPTVDEQEQRAGLAGYTLIMKGWPDPCHDAGTPSFARGASFGEVFGCRQDSDCTMSCAGAVNAKFAAKAMRCSDGCIQFGGDVSCKQGICTAPSSRGCSPGLFADAGLDEAPVSCDPVPRREPPQGRYSPRRLSPIDSHPQYALTVDSRFIYWTELNRLRRAPIAGGEAETLIPKQFVYSLVSADDDLFFGANYGRDLLVWPRAADTPRLLASSEQSAVHFLVSGEYLYWPDAGGLARISRRGGPREIVEPTETRLFAVDGDVRWWTVEDPRGAGVIKQRVGRGPELVVGQMLLRPPLLACGGAAFWLDTPYSSPRSGRLVRNRAGTSQIEIVALVTQLEALACDGGRLFWAEDWSEGQEWGTSSVIRSVGVDGQDQTDLALDRNHTVNAIAVGNGYVYWIANGLMTEPSFVSAVPTR